MDKKLFLAISLLIFLSVILAYLIIDKEYFGADHDIAIIRVRVSKTGLYLGEAVDITVIARNEGDETETFNVTSYYNLSIIETQTVSGLAAEEEVNLTFSWIPTDVSPANYRIKAESSMVSGEKDTNDNTMEADALIRVRRRPTETATLRVDPPMTSEGVGETFSININVSGAVDLYGWEFYLGWNATLLQALNVTEGGFLEQGGDTFFYPKINNTEGSMLVDCTLLGDIPGVDGHGILVTVQFSVEASGVSDLDLYETTLVSSLQQDIPHTTSDGSFSTTREKVAGIDHPQGYRPAH